LAAKIAWIATVVLMVIVVVVNQLPEKEATPPASSLRTLGNRSRWLRSSL
jgi:hypothetical protein